MDSESTKIILTKIEAVHSDTQDIKKRLFGNGRPGLILTVDRQGKWIEAQRWLQRLIVGAVIVFVVPAAITAIVYLIKHQGS